jgi:hypothetical protein
VSQIVKALLMNETQANEEVGATGAELAVLLEDALDSSDLEDAAQSYSEETREVVFSDGRIDVVDSCVDGQWQRCD